MRGMKIVVMAAVLVLFTAIGVNAAKEVYVLAEETEIMVKFDSTVTVSSGKTEPGAEINIYLARDIEISGRVVVQAGAKGTAKVVETNESTRPGKPGFIKIAFVELEPKGEFKTQDDGKIQLAGVMECKGKGRKFLSWLFILGLFIKGEQAGVDPGIEYPALIKETVVLESQ